MNINKIGNKAHESLNVESEPTLNFPEKEDVVAVPRETMYMIDRMVRQRTSRAKLALNQEIHQLSEENKYSHLEKSPIQDSLNIDYTEKNFRGSSTKKSKSQKSRDFSLDHSQRAPMTYEDWYRYVFLITPI